MVEKSETELEGLSIVTNTKRGKDILRSVRVAPKNILSTSSIDFNLYRDGSLAVEVTQEVIGEIKIKADLGSLAVIKEIVRQLEENQP